MLLKTYSRLAGDVADTTTRPQDTESTAPASEVAATEKLPSQPVLFEMTGTLENLIEQQTPVTREIVRGLSQQLGLSMQGDEKSVNQEVASVSGLCKCPAGRADADGSVVAACFCRSRHGLRTINVRTEPLPEIHHAVNPHLC